MRTVTKQKQIGGSREQQKKKKNVENQGKNLWCCWRATKVGETSAVGREIINEQRYKIDLGDWESGRIKKKKIEKKESNVDEDQNKWIEDGNLARQRSLWRIWVDVSR